jgi:hypothetical protein
MRRIKAAARRVGQDRGDSLGIGYGHRQVGANADDQSMVRVHHDSQHWIQYG